jgi:hypothetical protein
MNSSKPIGNSPAVLNFNRLFPKLNRFICNWLPVLPGHRVDAHVWDINFPHETAVILIPNQSVYLPYYLQVLDCPFETLVPHENVCPPSEE